MNIGYLQIYSFPSGISAEKILRTVLIERYIAAPLITALTINHLNGIESSDDSAYGSMQ